MRAKGRVESATVAAWQRNGVTVWRAVLEGGVPPLPVLQAVAHLGTTKQIVSRLSIACLGSRNTGWFLCLAVDLARGDMQHRRDLE